MTSKYFNKQGDKVNKRNYDDLVAQGLGYSRLCFENIGDVMVSIDWHGEFDDRIPNGLCCPYRVNIYNMVEGKWILEPAEESNIFNKLYKAERRFDEVVLNIRLKAGLLVIPIQSLTKSDKDDLEDFGEPVVDKNIPKTKSKNTGAW